MMTCRNLPLAVAFAFLLVTLAAVVAGPVGSAADSGSPALPPIDDLAAAAETLVDGLAPSLASRDAFEKAQDLERPTYVVALLANAVAEAEGVVKWKQAAPQVRDAALRLAKAKSYDDASKAYGEIQQLLANGAPNGGQAKPMTWVEIAPLKPVMVEVNVRNRPLTKMVRTPAQFKKDADTVRRNAAVLELLGSITAEHPKPKDGNGSQEEWQKWSVAMRDGAAELAKAAKAGDAAAAKTALTRTRASCSDCHAKFKPDADDDLKF